MFLRKMESVLFLLPGAFLSGAVLLVSMMGIVNVSAYTEEPIQPIPVDLEFDQDKAKLGGRLFSDPVLSSNNTISCESCHFLDRGGADSRSRSVGLNGSLLGRNSPTVFNAALNIRQLWDGRADTLEQQAEMALTNHNVMGMKSMDAVVEKLRGSGYAKDFVRVYGEPVNAANIRHAIAEFERSLLTPNSPFDRYLLGDDSAIGDKAKEGYQYFKSYGCVSCHQGSNVGGNMFQKFGVLKDINLREKGNLEVDLGRYRITKNEWDKNYFKVPSLRWVVHTPPYFHDGSAATLKEAIDVMTEFQLGRVLPEEEKLAIIEFLKTLPGELKNR